MPCMGSQETCTFEQAHLKWIAGDFEAFMSLMSDDIEWLVNIDGIQAPFASSAVGKDDLRWRLQHMLDVFSIASFRVEQFEHGPEVCRSAVRLVYIHRATGEPLDVMVRFTGIERDGLLVRMGEQADAAYVAVYARFVKFLEDSQREAGG